MFWWPQAESSVPDFPRSVAELPLLAGYHGFL